MTRAGGSQIAALFGILAEVSRCGSFISKSILSDMNVANPAFFWSSFA